MNIQHNTPSLAAPGGWWEDIYIPASEGLCYSFEDFTPQRNDYTPSGVRSICEAQSPLISKYHSATQYEESVTFFSLSKMCGVAIRHVEVTVEETEESTSVECMVHFIPDTSTPPPTDIHALPAYMYVVAIPKSSLYTYKEHNDILVWLLGYPEEPLFASITPVEREGSEQAQGFILRLTGETTQPLRPTHFRYLAPDARLWAVLANLKRQHLADTQDERELKEKERKERERQAKEKAEREAKERERKERERKEKERQEKEKKEKERKERIALVTAMGEYMDKIGVQAALIRGLMSMDEVCYVCRGMLGKLQYTLEDFASVSQRQVEILVKYKEEKKLQP